MFGHFWTFIHLVVVGKTPILTPTGRTIGHIVDLWTVGGGVYWSLPSSVRQYSVTQKLLLI